MLPQLIKIGDFFLPTYGVLVTLGFLAGLWVVSRLAVRSGLDREAVLNLGIYCALAGILGAKLLMFVLDLNYYWQNPREIFSFSTLQAGGVFQGGLVLALVTAFFYMRKVRLPGLLTADVLAPGVALGTRHRKTGLFCRGLLLGPGVPPALGGDLHQPRGQPTLRHAAQRSAASGAALRSRRRSPDLRGSSQSLPAAPPGRCNPRPVPAVVLLGTVCGGVLPLPRPGESLRRTPVLGPMDRPGDPAAGRLAAGAEVREAQPLQRFEDPLVLILAHAVQGKHRPFMAM